MYCDSVYRAFLWFEIWFGDLLKVLLAGRVPSTKTTARVSHACMPARVSMRSTATNVNVTQVCATSSSFVEST